MMHAKHAKMNISNTKTNVQNVSASLTDRLPGPWFLLCALFDFLVADLKSYPYLFVYNYQGTTFCRKDFRGGFRIKNE